MRDLRKIYLFARTFLIQRLILAKGFNHSEANITLESYLSLPDLSSKPVTLEELFFRLLSSAQNANMKASVIGGSIGGVRNLGRALFSFTPNEVVRKFADAPEKLLKHIVKVLQPNGKIRETPRSIWPQYCKTILSAAEFLTQFKDGEDFYRWANHFYSDEKSMAALPMILATEIEGVGYPLACDFLKELGFIDYGKPDVHVIKIFAGIGLCPEKASLYQVQKMMTQIANASDVSAYNVDKVFWLIGSGKFYKHASIGNIGRNREDFIEIFHKSI